MGPIVILSSLASINNFFPLVGMLSHTLSVQFIFSGQFACFKVFIPSLCPAGSYTLGILFLGIWDHLPDFNDPGSCCLSC